MMAVSQITHSKEEAIALAFLNGVTVTPFANDVSFVFVEHPLSGFNQRSMQTIRGNGFYIKKGQLNGTSEDRGEMRDQPNGKDGSIEAERAGLARRRRIYLSEY